MQLAILSRSLPGPQGGAIPEVVAGQAAALAAGGHRVSLWVDRVQPEDLQLAAQVGYRLVKAPGLDAPSGLRAPSLGEAYRRDLAQADAVLVQLGQPLFRDAVRQLVERTRVWVQLGDWGALCARGDGRPATPGVECPRGHNRGPCLDCLAPGVEGQEREELLRCLEDLREEQAREITAAGRVLVPSRTHLVRLSQKLRLDPARVRILSPQQGLVARPQHGPRNPWRGDGPLRLLHMGTRSADSGLEDLVRGLAVLPEDRVQLVLVGPEQELGLDERLRSQAGSLSLEFHDGFDMAQLRRQAARCQLAVFPSVIKEHGRDIAVGVLDFPAERCQRR